MESKHIIKKIKKIFGNDLDKKDSFGETKLYRAVYLGDIEKVEKLIKQGADVNIPETANRGWSPLMLAIFDGETHIVKKLIDAGADLEYKSERTQSTALGLAAFYGTPKTINLLLEAGANPNVQNDLGRTPLHYLSYRARALDIYMEPLENLLKHGANPRIKCKCGIDVIEEARFDENVLAVLNKYAPKVKRKVKKLKNQKIKPRKTKREIAKAFKIIGGRSRV